jgi:pimeloyl-ACP methyl ester carboxylesterase
MGTVYCISGLGADKHIFHGIMVPGIRWVYVPWLIPGRDEEIGVYAARMKASIPEENPVLLGVSFGGMMAIEIAKYLPAATVIIVSSIGHWRQLPVPIKLTKYLGLNRWTPPANLRLLAPFQDYFLGVETSADSRLARGYRGNVDPHLLQWSIRNIASWRNEWRPAHFYHLHGSKDRVFPLSRVEPTHVVAGGGHLMIHNRAPKISLLLGGILNGG